MIERRISEARKLVQRLAHMARIAENHCLICAAATVLLWHSFALEIVSSRAVAFLVALSSLSNRN